MQHTTMEMAGKSDSRSSSPSSFILFALLMTSFCGASSARGAVIAAWDFNEVQSGVRQIEAVVGSGSLSLSAFDDGWDLYLGTMANALDGWAAGDALGIRGQALNQTGMEMQLGVSFESAGVFSYAARRSGTGFTAVSLQAFDGVDWIGIGSESVSEKWYVGRFDLPSWLAHVESPLLRLEIDGARSPQGTIRFDNIVIESTVVPGPCTMWACLLGHGFVLGGRRRTSLAGRC